MVARARRLRRFILSPTTGGTRAGLCEVHENRRRPAPLSSSCVLEHPAAFAILTRMNRSNTGEERAINILRELHAAEEELIGRAVVMTDGKAGTIDHLYLDDVHGLRISISGHDGQWPISTVKLIQS